MKNTFKLFGFIALVAIIGLTMVACDTDGGGDDPIPAAWRGTWVGGGENAGVSIIITGTTLKVEGGGDFFTLGSVNITDGSTTHMNPSAWPNNYRVTGTVIASNGAEAPAVGSNYDLGQIYFNSGYTQFVIGYSTIAPNVFSK